MSSLDIGQCLQGLKEAYRGTTPVRQREGNDDDDNANDYDEPLQMSRSNSIGQEIDPEDMQRISLVESQLLLMFSTADDDDDSAKPVKVKSLPIQKMPWDPIASKPHSFPCKDTYVELPVKPSRWPQRPLMLRPTPYTSTKIRGIRRSNSTTYEHFPGFCAGCILPINSGSERKGDGLVIDFESPHFIGTIIMRIKQVPINTNNNSKQATSSYFDGKKRKFQAIVKGRFKTPLPMSQCVTGQTFNRPSGKLPAKWIVTSFVKFLSTLAPQLEATLEGDKPRFLTPLVATAQTVLVKPIVTDEEDSGLHHNLEEDIDEPPSVCDTSILARVQRELLENNNNHSNLTIPDTTKSCIASRMKARKKAFNAIAAHQWNTPTFALDKEYTFEFYQHLLDFGDELAIDMGRPIGQVGLSRATDGQPIKCMSAHQDPVTRELNSLWSFDIWHESLYSYAENALHS
jgi:hypothetical protein